MKENLMIAEKIFKTKPTIRAKDHHVDYVYYKSIGQSLRKVLMRKIHNHNKSNYEMPPINIVNESKTEGEFQSSLFKS
jgi:hypothetical protein